MNAFAAGLLGIIVAVIVMLTGIFVRWRYTGWKRFSFKQETTPYVSPPACNKATKCADGLDCVAGACYPKNAPTWHAGGAGAAALRFRNAVFTVVLPNGTRRSRDVTANLNAMAAAFPKGKGPATLTLIRPLNALSFTIPGFNGTNAVADAATKAALANAAVTLTGEWKTL